MADDSDASALSGDRKPSSRSEKASVKPTTSWVLPVITVAVLASAFCLYSSSTLRRSASIWSIGIFVPLRF